MNGIEEYKKAQEHESKYYHALNSKIDLTSKMHKKKAIEYYEKAADENHLDAMYRVALIASSGGLGNSKISYDVFDWNDEEKKEKVLYWLKRCAEMNHKEAIDALIDIYSYKIKNEQEKLFYLLKKYNNGEQVNLIEILDVYKRNDIQEGIQFLKKYIQENKIDLAEWQHTMDLAEFYEKANQIEQMHQCYRLAASSNTYSYNKAKAYDFVANEYYEKKDYVNAVRLYKFMGYNSMLKKMAQNNEGFTPKEYFEYIKSKSYLRWDLGECYLEGFGVEKNEKEGFKCLMNEYERLKSYEATHGKTQTFIYAYHLVKIGDCYYNGKGTGEFADSYKALKYYLEAEKKPDYQNYCRDKEICYCMYINKDYSNVFKRLLALEKKYGNQYVWTYEKLGEYYFNGYGCIQDYKAAFKYYQKGADLKSSDCMNGLGDCFSKGLGTPKNPQKAFEYYKKAYDCSQQGLYAYNIAACYEKGEGVTKNLDEAYSWYNIAWKKRHFDAWKKRNEIKKEIERMAEVKNQIVQENVIQQLEEKQKEIIDVTKEIVESVHKLANKEVNTSIEVKTKIVDGSAKQALNELIGLDSVKKEIQELEDFIKVTNIRKQRGLPTTQISKHMVFTGNAGTGKTTVARIVAQIYKENGVVKQGQLIETDREGLVGQYIGETAKKTRQVIEKAIGGVLFIDEAYLLVPQDSGKDFGPEAIGVLLKMMEDHKDDLVVIVAGYKDEMKHFIDSNPGLKSRFTSYIDFEDYTPEQMQKIFELKAEKDKFKVEEKAKDKLIDLWKESSKYRNLGNGRCVRNVYEKVQRLQSTRIIRQNLMSDEDLSTIMGEDIPKFEDIFR